MLIKNKNSELKGKTKDKKELSFSHFQVYQIISSKLVKAKTVEVARIE